MKKIIGCIICGMPESEVQSEFCSEDTKRYGVSLIPRLERYNPRHIIAEMKVLSWIGDDPLEISNWEIDNEEL